MRSALALFVGLLAAPLAVAQTDAESEPVPALSLAEAPTASRKEPVLGHVLGYLVPGGGHFYAGEASTGGLLLATSVAGYALVVTAFPHALGGCLTTPGPSSCDQGTEETALALGLGLVIGSALYSVVDGGRAVRRTNQRNGHVALAPRATLAPSGDRLALRVRL